MDFNTIVRLIVDSGVGIACSALICFIFYRLVAKLMKNEEELRRSSDEQNRTLLQHILDSTPYHITPQRYSENVLIDKEIDSMLSVLKDKMGASRASLVTFHNGGRDLSGLSFLKMSMRNEVTAPSIKPIQQEFQAVFRNTLAYWCNELADKGYCYIDNFEDVKDVDYGLYDYMNSRDIKSMYGISIQNKDKDIIGFISIEFTTSSVNTSQQIDKFLKDKKSKIETLLAVVNKAVVDRHDG